MEIELFSIGEADIVEAISPFKLFAFAGIKPDIIIIKTISNFFILFLPHKSLLYHPKLCICHGIRTFCEG